MAEIIRLKKFIYDIWGDTVNTASRLESHGVPGRIQITADTATGWRLLTSSSGAAPSSFKGKGEVDAWFLVAWR